MSVIADIPPEIPNMIEYIFPNIKPTISTLARSIRYAYTGPKTYSAIRETIFAKPSFIPGIPKNTKGISCSAYPKTADNAVITAM